MQQLAALGKLGSCRSKSACPKHWPGAQRNRESKSKVWLNLKRAGSGIVALADRRDATATLTSAGIAGVLPCFINS